MNITIKRIPAAVSWPHLKLTAEQRQPQCHGLAVTKEHLFACSYRMQLDVGSALGAVRAIAVLLRRELVSQATNRTEQRHCPLTLAILEVKTLTRVERCPMSSAFGSDIVPCQGSHGDSARSNQIALSFGTFLPEASVGALGQVGQPLETSKGGWILGGREGEA